MKPTEPLFDKLAPNVLNTAPDMLYFADASHTLDKISNWAKEDCQTLAFPRIKQVRWAVQRVLKEVGVTFPNGRVYVTPGFDTFDLHADKISDDDHLAPPSMHFESRLAIVTSESNEDGKVSRFLEDLLKENEKSSGTAFIHMTTPVTAPIVCGIETINFIVVKATSGESYWYTLEENDNKGKVLKIEALQDEFGTIRESFGPIDTLPIKAVKANPLLRDMMFSEIKKVAKDIVIEKPQKVTKTQAIKQKAEKVGQSVIKKVTTVTKQ